MKKPTKFDRHLESRSKSPDFAARFQKAGRSWDVAMQLAALRNAAGLSQKELAARIGTSRQQISRIESPGYEGHSLGMIRRVAEALGATVRVEIEKGMPKEKTAVAEAVEKHSAEQPQSGRVAARKCPHCGHHEIGMEDSDGRFVALKPGTKVTLDQG